MFKIKALLILVLSLVLVGCYERESSKPYLPAKPYHTRDKGVYITDEGGRSVGALEVGSSLSVGVRGLEANRMYEFRLGIGPEEVMSLRDAVSFARVGTDRNGDIAPFILWYQSGVVGCSARLKTGTKLTPFNFRTFAEAEEQLKGKVLRVSVHPVERDKTGKKDIMKLMVGKAESVIDLPVVSRKHPLVYPSDSEGCLVNSCYVGSDDLYVSGLNFKPGQLVEISVVPNQRKWYVGDAINDVTGIGSSASPERVKANSRGRFTARVWSKATQRRGVYDIIAKPYSVSERLQKAVVEKDIISFGADTGFILCLRYPPGGPTMDIAGRPISSGSPYFEYADSFAKDGDAVWGAVDPTYVPDGHPGGKYAAYYVVAHRSVDEWASTISLTDASGGVEVKPVKASCINGTDFPIWNPPLDLGEYDVVVDFGVSPAENETSFATDSQYNSAVDFLDGADQIGFIVAEDPNNVAQAPYVAGKTYPIGQASYSYDDYFASLGTASNVDLRAVVRYPAVSAGLNTAVAAGQHPIFIIEHGNHSHCEVCKDSAGNPVVCNYSVVSTCSDLVAISYTHAECPQRTPNHEGYMHLLDVLASHGIIAVSIDAYDLTGSYCLGVNGWIAERGQLILKHLELWSHMNNPSTYPGYPDSFAGKFLNHVDMNKISVCGHSRGGEASVSAYMQNVDFNIVSVSSIAPVDFEGYNLPDVPYFVILPAGDGDVDELSGIRIYDRSGSLTVPVDSTTKSGIYVYGANHNFFNTVWADDSDDSSPSRDDYIQKQDQQRIGEAYLSAFTRIHLNGESVYEDMLRGRLTFPSTAGFKIYHFHHEKNHSKFESGSGAGAVATDATKTSVSGPSVHVTQALKVQWTGNTGKLTYSVPSDQNNASGFEVLSFRVTQTNSNLNPANGPQDFKVELVGGGKQKAFYCSRFDEIPKPYDHPDYPYNHNVMTTVRIPLHSFIMNKSGVKLEDVNTIRFCFNNPSQGEIYVDDIEFSR